MVVLTPLIRKLKEQFPNLFDWWEEDKLRALGFREGDIDVIHESFEGNVLYTGILVLLAFTHGDCYPISSIEEILGISVGRILKALGELIQRKVVYSEKFLHPAKGWNFYYADRDLLLSLVREYKLESAKRRIKRVQPSEAPLSVFVSSVMNKNLEDLETERQMARVGIEELEFTRPWLFEEVPASSETLPEYFLMKIRRSDFFILILGQHITDVVELEYQIAQDSGINCLVFVKEGVERSNRAKQFLSKVNVKYKEFWNPNDLRTQVTASLADDIVRLTRKRQESRRKQAE